MRRPVVAVINAFVLHRAVVGVTLFALLGAGLLDS